MNAVTDERWVQMIAARVTVDVCELERDSPEGDPMACIVYAGELTAIVERRVTEALTAALSIRQGGMKAALTEAADYYHKGIPVAAKLAAVRAYVGKSGSCQPAAMLAALQAAAPFLASPAQVVADEGLVVKYRAMWQGEVDDFDLQYGKRIIGDEYERGTCDTHREEQRQRRVDTLREVLPVLYALTPSVTP